MKKLDVHFCGWGQQWQMGTLAHAGSAVLFEYSAEALHRQLAFSPLRVALRKAAYQGFPASQEQLPGFLADALPDGWGRRLMDQCFLKDNRTLASISPLDRLAFIHDRALGAFVFTPADVLSEDPEYIALLALAQGAQSLMAGQDTATLHQLALAGGSPQGARPKVLVHYDSTTQNVSTQRSAPGTPWLVKFQAQGEAKEVCAIEALYAQLAGQCGLDMPATKYFDLSAQLAGFGIERFDRHQGLRVPVLSLAALLEDNFRVPTRDYTTFLKATRALTMDEREVKKAFERCVFNVVFHNRDDHTKNFSYSMDAAMAWKLSPCFDLTFNTGINWEHQMTVCGEGRHPGKSHLLALARTCDVPEAWARQTIERMGTVAGTVAAAASGWPISHGTVQLLHNTIETNRACLR
jgi:serine/threonine-protein kinase HipA